MVPQVFGLIGICPQYYNLHGNWKMFLDSKDKKAIAYTMKVRNSNFSGYHGNRFQFWWILGNRHPMGNICAKFQVSSFNGLSVIMSRTHPRGGLVDLIKGTVDWASRSKISQITSEKMLQLILTLKAPWFWVRSAWNVHQLIGNPCQNALKQWWHIKVSNTKRLIYGFLHSLNKNHCSTIIMVARGSVWHG